MKMADTRHPGWVAFQRRAWAEAYAELSGAARGRRLIDEEGLDCAEAGYVRIPTARQNLEGATTQRRTPSFTRRVSWVAASEIRTGWPCPASGGARR